MTGAIAHLIDNSGSVFYFSGKQHIRQSVYEQSYIFYRSYLKEFVSFIAHNCIIFHIFLLSETVYYSLGQQF